MTKTAKAPKTFREQLLAAIGKVDRPGAVCVSRDLPLTMPGLEVDGIGTIRLPLGKTQAHKLIGACAQAPYGKGTQTLVDTDVRRVWELDPQRLQLTNPNWNKLIVSITGEAQTALGLEQTKLTAHLYKLLVYEQGSFFLPHRDGEKLDGMVATLVVCLPSPHKGGELIVSHEGRRHEIAFGGAAAGHELSYAAFYADCEHEVRPVRDGYRLCLVYNLTLAKSRGKKSVTAPATGAAVAAIGELLRAWPAKGDVAKVAIALDHHYSQDGLRIETLKGIDRARADVLFAAADEADCVAHLGLITHWQSGSDEGGADDYSYGSYRRGSWSDDEDDEDEQDSAGSDHQMGEIYDQSLSVDHWSDREGKKIALGAIDLDEQEVVSAQPPEDWEIGREEFEGYTGNAGMTLERWYHRAAMILWPRKSHFQVLCGAGTDAAIAGLGAMVKRWKRARKSEREQQRTTCVEFATAIIETWGPRQFHPGSYDLPIRADRSLFPPLLQQLQAPELMRRFLSQVMPGDGEIEIDKSFPAFCEEHGWASFEQSLADVVDGSSAATIERNVELLKTVCLQRDKDADRVALCRRLAERIVAALERVDQKSPKYDWQSDEIDRAALLTALVKSLTTVEATQSLARLMDRVLAPGGKYDLTDAHLKAIFALAPWLTGKSLTGKSAKPNRIVREWLKSCRIELEKRTAQAPVPPADLRRAAKLSCNCADCRELSRFLADPGKLVGRFPLAEGRRRHLHQIIDNNRCDLTHVTKRTGRPYELVCTKTRASHQRASEIHKRDQANLKRVRAIESKIGVKRAHNA